MDVPPLEITLAVEGATDEVVVGSVIRHVGAISGFVYGRNGKDYLRTKVQAFNHAAVHSPWVIVVDLNDDAPCAPQLRTAWLPSPSRFMCFRIAVRMIESWLIADSARLAQFLGIRIAQVPTQPDELEDPKQTMVNLARSSRRRDIVRDMVPRTGSRARVGPAYVSRLIEFAQEPAAGWRPDIAMSRSNSLERCIRAISTLTAQWKDYVTGSRRS